MARISKYGVEIADRIVEYISLWHTLRDTSYAADVSEETIRRWRDCCSNFNKRVVEASKQKIEELQANIVWLENEVEELTDKIKRPEQILLTETEFLNLLKKCSTTDERLRFCRKGHFAQIYLLEPAN